MGRPIKQAVTRIIKRKHFVTLSLAENFFQSLGETMRTAAGRELIQRGLPGELTVFKPADIADYNSHGSWSLMVSV
jgi:hypothetical protein